jgi:hypothetical protein
VQKCFVATVGSVSVVLVQWPRDAALRDDLARQGVPRLLLVAKHAPPPFVHERLEDWVRVPADEQELFVRLERLSDLASPEPVWPEALSVVEARLLERLRCDLGRLVPRAVLSQAAWGEPRPSTRALDSAIARLRVKLRPVGYTVVGIRNRGFVLAALDGNDA